MSKGALVASLIIVIGILGLFFGYKYLPGYKAPVQPVSTPVAHVTPAPTKSAQLANPASENCIKQGGRLIIKKRGDGGEFGLCEFEDNRGCEEWALMRGECPGGGVKTTGFDTEAQRYCAWLGGKTSAVKNARCTFSSGKICDDNELFSGKCSSN